MTKISIVLPVYNVEKYLEKTLASILNQSFEAFELICVDDGSTDTSPQILADFAKKDPRITIVAQKNQGPGQARNTGLDTATGEYVIMLDSDDIYESDMLSKLLNKAEETHADIVVCRSSEFDSKSGKESEAWWTLNVCQLPNKVSFSPHEMPDFIFTAFVGWPWDKLYRRSFIEEHGFRFPKLSNSEDLYFVFLSLAKAQTISVVEEPLVHHRVNRAGSVSASRAKEPLQFYESTCLLKKELQKDPSFYSKVSWGFLNWAFTYLLWNIETMDDPSGRAIQLEALKNNGFPELEIGLHSPAFFSLEPSGYGRYLSLLREAEKLPTAKPKGHRILGLAIRVLSKWQQEGLRSTVSASSRVLRRKLLRAQSHMDEPDFVRGADFSITGFDAKERLNKGRPSKDRLNCDSDKE